MKPHKIYADYVDPKALDQFYTVMKHPAIIKGALMPDVHAGYTLPIGGVVLADNMVFPAFVGYDIGCTDKDTEYLTTRGWKKISEYNGEDILVYNKDTDTSYFEAPVNYIVKECEEFYHLNNGTVDQMLSDDHKVLLYLGYKSRGYKAHDFLMKDLMDHHFMLKKGVQGSFKTTFNYTTKNQVRLTEPQIRLQVAIAADGCIRERKTVPSKIEFHLKKDRKINRLKQLLSECNISYTEYNIKDGSFSCSFTPPVCTKSLGIFWNSSAEQLKVIADEYVYWDGCTNKGRFSSTDKAHVDLIQFALASSGIRSGIHHIANKQEAWKDTYNIYTSKSNMVELPRANKIVKVKSADGKSYCFTTTTGYWVMRRNGKIVVTGNCGVCAIETTFDKQGIQNYAEDIFRTIYKYVPVGFKHSEQAAEWEYKKYPMTSTTEKIFEKNGLNQLGTLGGGNHFIEIGYDEQDKVYVVIHSGSRNVGHTVATHYMKLASGTDKAKEGCYGFTTDSQEGKDYIMDQMFCLEFALENRVQILDKVCLAIQEFTKGKMKWDSLINRTHNHALVMQDGVIHRKGATHAEDGMMGVIPGNMRDGSFIVRGKGNPDSLWSSSHGAGRVLGRKAANEAVDIDEFVSEMKGITAKVDKDTLDESPMAYKDIFAVMEQQKDLVEVIKHIKPILNVKG